MVKNQLYGSLKEAIIQFHAEVNNSLTNRERDKKDDKVVYISECTKEITKSMLPLANQFLFGGYIHVTGNDNGVEIDKKIYLVTIEFYYHECNGKDNEIENRITDYTMYHIPDSVYKKKGKSLTYKDKWRLKRFPVGSLHMHQCGIDITFEDNSESDRFRASILIREYKVDENEKSTVDIYPTHIYDELSFDIGIMGSPKLTIQWIDEAKGEIRELKGEPRINVFEYDSELKKKKESPDIRPWSFNKGNIIQDQTNI